VGTSSIQPGSPESADKASCDMFNRYVSVDVAAQTAANSSEAELMVSVTTDQSAGDHANNDET